MKTLLEKQVYPDPNLRTYDDASWTMGLMSHAEVKETTDKRVFDPGFVRLAPVVEKEIHLAGTIDRIGIARQRSAHYGSNNMITLRYRLRDMKFQAVEKEFKQGDVALPAGSFVIIRRRCASEG